MGAVKLNVSMDEQTVETMRRRASETGKPISRYLAELVEEEAKQAQDELAIEGYRTLTRDTQAFAGAAWPLAAELPWVWDESDPIDAAGSWPEEGSDDKPSAPSR